MKPITIGAVGAAKTVVTQKVTAIAQKSGSLPVLATPAMVALMEEAACNALEPFLEEGETTVGTALQIEHVAATSVGMMISALAEVTAVSGRAITLQVTAADDAGEIGRGTHQRVLVQAVRFLDKAEKRKEASN